MESAPVTIPQIPIEGNFRYSSAAFIIATWCKGYRSVGLPAVTGRFFFGSKCTRRLDLGQPNPHFARHIAHELSFTDRLASVGYGKKLLAWIVLIGPALWSGFILTPTSALADSVQRHVGPTTPHETISEALAAANDGDVIVVHTGVYDDVFRWNKDVDIVEAAGAHAILRPRDRDENTESVVQIELPAGANVSWKGIDIEYRASRFKHVFISHKSQFFTAVHFKNFSVRDNVDSGDEKKRLRFFSTHDTEMHLENVSVNLRSEVDEAYEIIVGALGAGSHVSIKNCDFSTPSAKILACEGANAELHTDGCLLEQTQHGRFVADLTQANIVHFNDTHFAGPTASRGLLCRGFGSLEVLCTNCTWDREAIWYPITLEKSLELTLINCCVPHNPETAAFSILNKQCTEQCHLAADSTITLLHSTFASTNADSKFQSQASGVRSEAPGGRTTHYFIANCIFSLPGSTVGAIDNREDATIIVTAGPNLRFLGHSATAANDLMDPPGNQIYPGDPKLLPDLCHLGQDSAAIDSTDPFEFWPHVNELVHMARKDVDGHERPSGSRADFGADESLDIGPGPIFKRGDADLRGTVDFSDALDILRFLFIGSFDPMCLDALDTDDRGSVELNDGLHLLKFLFLGGVVIPAPGTKSCGIDPTPDTVNPPDLGCEREPDEEACSVSE